VIFQVLTAMNMSDFLRNVGNHLHTTWSRNWFRRQPSPWTNETLYLQPSGDPFAVALNGE